MKDWKKTYYYITPILAGCLFSGCIEPFETTFVDFESALVIDATITDELKRQIIYLSRTYRFEDDPNGGSGAIFQVVDNGKYGESGANIQIFGDDGSSYNFEETEKGTYLSTVDFAAKQGVDYSLAIETEDGNLYSSATEKLAGLVGIDSLYANRITNDFGEEGIGVFIDASNQSETQSFFRYEYEETYKVVAPRWGPKELEVVEGVPISYILVPRSLDERVCYPTDYSNSIILTDTDDFDTGEVKNFMVKFIEQNNFKTTHRYSILVRQFVHTSEAYRFLETLNNFSSSESLFSETQPGFLEGNIASTDNPTEKVLGFFDIVAVSEKRIFFGYRDFFPTERLPDYIDPCVENAPIFGLPDLVRWNLVKYIRDNEGEFVPGGPFVTVPQVCGDCTILGTSEVPDFWIE